MEGIGERGGILSGIVLVSVGKNAKTTEIVSRANEIGSKPSKIAATILGISIFGVKTGGGVFFFVVFGGV